MTSTLRCYLWMTGLTRSESRSGIRKGRPVAFEYTMSIMGGHHRMTFLSAVVLLLIIHSHDGPLPRPQLRSPSAIPCLPFFTSQGRPPSVTFKNCSFSSISSSKGAGAVTLTPVTAGYGDITMEGCTFQVGERVRSSDIDLDQGLSTTLMEILNCRDRRCLYLTL